MAVFCSYARKELTPLNDVDILIKFAKLCGCNVKSVGAKYWGKVQRRFVRQVQKFKEWVNKDGEEEKTE